MDDKKLNELLASLTDEQKEKAKACKTAKELIDFLAEAGVELPDEALDKVAGGVGLDEQGGTNPDCDTPPKDDNRLTNIINKRGKFHMQ